MKLIFTVYDMTLLPAGGSFFVCCKIDNYLQKCYNFFISSFSEVWFMDIDENRIADLDEHTHIKLILEKI